MPKGIILFKELSMPFDLITTHVQLSSVRVFIPYSDEYMLCLIENSLTFNVVENAEELEGKYLRVRVYLSDIKAVIFDND